MHKLLIISFALLPFLFSCNNADSDKATKPAVDSFTLANSEYAVLLQDLQPNRDISAILCQGWELDDDLESINNNNEAMGILPFRSFYLSPDGSMVSNPRNAIDFGKWAYDDAAKTITLNQEKDGKTVYKIVSIKYNELIVINSSIKSNTRLRFVSAGKRYKDPAENPYHAANNQWRIAPKKPETEAAIRERLKGCIHFFVLFYRDNLAKDNKVISFYGFPTCLKWYAGGIFMVKEADLKENWFNCFYNKEQSMQAYRMMESIIGKKYNWPKGQMSWVKKNLVVLQQMYDNL